LLDDLGGWIPPGPAYVHPGKKWRVKRGSIPNWYKLREGVRRHAQSGAARVARHRPRTPKPY
jgi:sec-independent protein translocase protein TatB